MQQKTKQTLTALALIAPAFVLLVTFTHLPAFKAFINSFFTTARGRRPSRWAGLDNYETLIGDPVFWKVMKNNLIYALGTIPLSVLIALAMALFVNQKLAGRGFVRMAYFTPTVLPMIAVANIWLFFYTPGFGLFDQIGGLFGFGHSNVLGSADSALWGVIVVTIWKEAGFFMIFYLAALQTIPTPLIEAARIEGAGAVTIFRRVTLPLLMPTTLFVSINAVVNSFRVVDHIFVLTGGGPDNASTILLFYIYETAFRFWDTAYAAVLTVVMLVCLIVLAIGQFFFFDRKVHYR